MLTIVDRHGTFVARQAVGEGRCSPVGRSFGQPQCDKGEQANGGDEMSVDHEREWFEQWCATLEREVEMYASLHDELYLRPAEIAFDLELAMCRAILRDAVRNCGDAWAHTAGLFRSTEPLTSILSKLFGSGIPLPVAVAAIEVVAGAMFGDSDAPDVVVGRALVMRERECRAVGRTAYGWRVVVRGGKATVSVSRRREQESARALVTVVDDRKQTSAGPRRDGE